MKKTLTIIAIAILSMTAYARTNYSTNGVADNLFVTVGAGLNGVLDNGTFAAQGFAADITVGKWYTPYIATRMGYHGLTNKSNDTSNGWFAGNDSFGYNYLHGDLMWNITNTILGYREDRLLDVIPYAHAGLVWTSYNGNVNNELGTGVGCILQFRVLSWLDAQADLMMNHSREEAWRNAGKVICFPSLTVGLTANFGRSTYGWKEANDKVRVETVEVLRDCDHEAAMAALMATNDSLSRLSAKVDTVQVTKYLNNGMVTYFVINKYDINQAEMYHLMDLVGSIPGNATLSIVGHADKETGSARRNAFLAQKRVELVEKALRELGFQGTINTDYKGDSANPFPGKAPKNRCVTITVSCE